MGLHGWGKIMENAPAMFYVGVHGTCSHRICVPLSVFGMGRVAVWIFTMECA